MTDMTAPLTDNQFHSLGVGLVELRDRLGQVLQRLDALGRPVEADDILGDREVAALGRYVITRKLEDIGKFRTPSLRNVAVTAPYFHDGSVPSLEASVDLELYYRRHADGSPLPISRDERNDILDFLRSLTNEDR